MLRIISEARGRTPKTLMSAFNVFVLAFVLFGYAVGPFFAIILVMRINKAASKELQGATPARIPEGPQKTPTLTKQISQGTQQKPQDTAKKTFRH